MTRHCIFNDYVTVWMSVQLAQLVERRHRMREESPSPYIQSSLGLSNGLCAVRRVVVGECSEVGRGVLVLSQILPKRSFDKFWSWNRHTFLGENTTPFFVSFSESALVVFLL